MNGFIAIAGLLTLAALAALLYPLLRKGDATPEAWRSAGIATLAILLGSIALYPLWSNYAWHEPQAAADTPLGMVGRLARRLEKQPEDLQGWLMLGRSYAVLGQSDQDSARWFELSARAYQRADNLAKGQNLDALIGLGEALVESGRSELGGRAGRVFEQALKLEDAPVKVLIYSAIAAFERSELPLAKERFEELLGADPPPAVAQFINEYLQQIDVQLAMTGAPQGGVAPSGNAPAATAPVAIPLRITLAAAVADKAVAGARLFVIARTPGQRGGPPLAVRPVDGAEFPLDVALRSTDAMLGGNGFAAGQELEIEARIANGGDASSRSGDPFGVVRVNAGGNEPVTLEINQLKP